MNEMEKYLGTVLKMRNSKREFLVIGIDIEYNRENKTDKMRAISLREIDGGNNYLINCYDKSEPINKYYIDRSLIDWLMFVELPRVEVLKWNNLNLKI